MLEIPSLAYGVASLRVNRKSEVVQNEVLMGNAIGRTIGPKQKALPPTAVVYPVQIALFESCNFSKSKKPPK